MKRILDHRPSPALAVAFLALFISLGGVSYGLATGSIDSREIKDNAIRSKDVRNDTLLSRDIRNNRIFSVDIRNGTIRRFDVADDTLRGKQIDESRLEQVPSAADADTLGGQPPDAYAPAAAEPVRLVGATGEPPFQNGASAAGGGVLDPGFWKDPFGTVHLQGTLVVITDAPAFTLPAGYRPAGEASFPVTDNVGDTGHIRVDPDGDVQLLGSATPTLDGITFRAEG